MTEPSLGIRSVLRTCFPSHAASQVAARSARCHPAPRFDVGVPGESDFAGVDEKFAAAGDGRDDLAREHERDEHVGPAEKVEQQPSTPRTLPRPNQHSKTSLA